jgi:hypothetical protein
MGEVHSGATHASIVKLLEHLDGLRLGTDCIMQESGTWQECQVCCRAERAARHFHGLAKKRKLDQAKRMCVYVLAVGSLTGANDLGLDPVICGTRCHGGLVCFESAADEGKLYPSKAAGGLPVHKRAAAALMPSLILNAIVNAAANLSTMGEVLHGLL